MMQGYRVGNYNISPSTSVPVVYRAQVSEGHLAEPQLLSMVSFCSAAADAAGELIV